MGSLMTQMSTHWRTGTWGDDVVHQAGRRLRHATSAARGAEAAPLATEGDELVVAAVTAAKPQEAMGQDSALEEGVELGLGRSAADRPWRKHAPGPLPAAGQSAGTALRAGSAPVAASVLAMNVAACCCTRRYSVVCSGRWHS